MLAAGFEEIEALSVVDLLRRAEITTDLVSITNKYTVEGAHNISVIADKVFKEVDFTEVDMIVLPGGMPGTKNLEAFEPLMEQLDCFHNAAKHIAAICAAPSILGHRGMLRGKKACCFPGFEDELKEADVTKNPIEKSEHIITSRGMGTAIDFGLEIVACFKGQESAHKLAEKIIYLK